MQRPNFNTINIDGKMSGLEDQGTAGSVNIQDQDMTTSEMVQRMTAEG